MGATPTVVLDAWAVLAWLQGEEPAAGDVDDLLQRSHAGEVRLLLSIVNAGEVFYRVAKVRGPAAGSRLRGDLERLPLTLVSADDALVWAAAGLKARAPLSYADAFAVALAQREGAPVATGDPEIVQARKALDLTVIALRRE